MPLYSLQVIVHITPFTRSEETQQINCKETQVRKKGRRTTYAAMAEITGGDLDFSSYVSTTMDRARGERDNTFRSTIRQFVEYKWFFKNRG